MRPSRRQLLGLTAAGLLVPRRLAATSPTRGRKFLFVFNPGGWDPAFVFAPVFSDTVGRTPTDFPGQVGDLPFTDSEMRPSVRGFLEAYGERTVFINGIEVPSLAHDVCTKWAMTGDGRARRDDWVSTIAAGGDPGLLLPNVHVSGPIFPLRYPTASVRVGVKGQLSSLLDGTAGQLADAPEPALADALQAAQEPILRRALDRWRGERGRGRAELVAEAESVALERSAALAEFTGVFAGDASDLTGALDIAAGCLEAGLSRTAMVAYGTGGNGAWDTHSSNEFQSVMFEALFSALATVTERLSAAPGAEGGSLLDETVIVVLSEMGRTPQYNAASGKDHWTWTSAMLVGSGLRGGRVVGSWSDGLTGGGVDLATGESSASGATLLPGHVGATLLALADLDPAEFVDAEEGEAISGILA